jgi:hypothetical protein
MKKFLTNLSDRTRFPETLLTNRHLIITGIQRIEVSELFYYEYNVYIRVAEPVYSETKFCTGNDESNIAQYLELLNSKPLGHENWSLDAIQTTFQTFSGLKQENYCASLSIEKYCVTRTWKCFFNIVPLPGGVGPMMSISQFCSKLWNFESFSPTASVPRMSVTFYVNNKLILFNHNKEFLIVQATEDKWEVITMKQEKKIRRRKIYVLRHYWLKEQQRKWETE